MKTAAGLFQVQRPQIRGREEPFRSALWGQRATTRDVLKRFIGEMYVGGLSQRDIEDSLESAPGHCVLGKRTERELRAT